MTEQAAAAQIPTFPDLPGKVAVVTGGSKGIGASTCRMLAASGVKVAIAARGEEAIARLVGDLRADGAEALGVRGDCTNPADLQRIREEVEAALGPVDILIAFAGGFTRATPITDLNEEEWRAIVDSNLTATFLTVKAFLPGMIERRCGVIVTMASNAGRLLDITLNAAYAAAKGGIVVFTRHLAKEIGPQGIRANCVAPATVSTKRVEALMSDDRRASIADMAPLGRLGKPEDVAAATLFLCSDAAAWITGVTLDVAGGRVML
jgi:3-oxoacyl-[acyl-carrier protein] reductase